MELTRDYINPTSTSSGNFGGQLTALALSLGFSDCLPNFGTDCGNLKDLFICDSREQNPSENRNTNNGNPRFPNCAPFFGMTIEEVFETANRAIGGCCNSEENECDPQSLNECVTLINQAFAGGKRLNQVTPRNIFSRTQCSAPPTCESGCSDGQREGFTDLNAYPCIAACAASWTVPGVVGKTKTCNGQSGNNFNITRNPTARCSVADACAPGWHVCASSSEVASRLRGGSCSDAGQGFYVSQQSGGGCGMCAIGTRNCSVGTCDSNCMMNQNTRNDIFGCGSNGINPDASCSPLNKFGNDGCSSLPNNWRCTAGFSEADNVIKTNTQGGGVLCCKDTCSPSGNRQCI
jgi:hypothetical protein